MSIPLTFSWHEPVSAPFLEPMEPREFVDGEWRPKHPDSPPDYYPYRDGHEFIDGEWVEKHMSVESDYISLKLGSAMLQHALASKAGRVQGSKCGFQCFPDDPKRIRLPDVTFIRANRVTADVYSSGNCPVVPDIAAEVISPNDEAEALAVKVHQYLVAGVQLVWLIYPKPKAIWVLRSNGTGGWLSGSALLSGEDILPGFTIALETLFAKDVTTP